MLVCKLSFDACYWRVYGLQVVSRISNQIIWHFYFLVQSSALQSIKIMIMKGINSQITLMKTVSHDLEFLVFRAFPCKKDEWGEKKKKKKNKKQKNKTEIAFSCRVLMCMLNCFSPVWLFATLWTIVHKVSLCPWASPGRTLEWVVIFFSRGIFPTQRSSPRLLQLLHCTWILYPLSYLGSSDF